MTATGKESSLVVRRSAGDYPKPISGVNRVVIVKEINREVGGSLESHRCCFLFECPYKTIYVCVCARALET